MMVSLLIYGYCVGKPSSRKIERATYEDVGFRVLAGDRFDLDFVVGFRLVDIDGVGQRFCPRR